MQCPLCRSQSFYIKDPNDEYEMYRFDVREGQVCFDSEIDTSLIPALTDSTETFCDKCSWHGKFTTAA